MKNIICLIFISCMLVACGNGNSDNNLPQECKDIFETIEAIQLKMETSSYVPASMATEYKRQNAEFISNFKKSLAKADRQRQIQSCTPSANVLKNQLERLNNAKSEADVKQIFYGL